jgi:LuxR family maltose regulon positive regulatory protein
MDDAPLTLLRTKLYRPLPGRSLVLRQRLLDRLPDRPEAGLTLISAPAGSGKTTLLVQWLERLSWPVAWLSLDETDDDLIIFLSYVTAAIQGTYPEACSLTQKLIRTPQPPPVDYLAATLVNELSQIADGLVLVLEDYHCIRKPSIHHLVGRLLRHTPPALHLVISSRFDPPLPLSRLASQGKLVEIRPADLRFRSNEAQALLEGLIDFSLPQERIDALVEEMEGWAAGLHSVALSLRGSGDWPPSIGDRAAGDYRRLVGILADEVFAMQPADVREFLMRTSVLSQLTAPLCQALYADDTPTTDSAPDSQAMLQRLERDSLFVETLDEGRRWYRYHNLFRSFLARKLEQTASQADIAALHRRASIWHWAQGSPGEAIQHALAGHDAALAAEIVEGEMLEILVREDWPTLERWLNLLAGEAIQRRPRLLVAQAWVLYFHFKLSGIPPLLAQAQALLAEGGVDATATSALVRPHVEALSTVLYFAAGDYAGALASAQSVLADSEPGQPLSRGFAIFFRGLAQYALSGADEAIALCSRIVDDPLEEVTVRARALQSIGHIYGIACLPVEQERAGLALLKLAQEHGLDLSTAWAHRHLGSAYLELYELDRAVEHFARGVELRYLAHFVCARDCYGGLALAYLAQGRREEAEAAASALQAFYADRGLANLPEYDLFQARFWFLLGDTDRALQVLARSQPVRATPSMVAYETTTLTHAMVHILAGSDAQRQAAVLTLGELQRMAEETHATWHLIRILALRAIALQLEDQPEEALDVMRQAYLLGYPGRVHAIFVELGAPARRLLQRLAERGVESAYLRDLLAAYASGAGAPKASRPGAQALSPNAQLVEPLSARELEVLALLSQRLSNKEIAAKLVISPLTVKRHMTNIMQKLGVDSRWDAAERAREIGLIPPA